MEKILMFLISVLPVILIGSFIYYKDYENEPTKLIFKLFFGGVLSLIITYVISLTFGISHDIDTSNRMKLFLYCLLGVGLVEEFSKGFITYKFSYNSKHFNHKYDMILYSTFVALGFACFENFLYVFQNGLPTGVLRFYTAIPGHAADGIIIGYFLSLAKMSEINGNKNEAIKNKLLALIVPTVFHGLYDYFAYSGNSVAFYSILIIKVVISILIIYKLSKNNDNIYTKRN